MNSSPDSKHKKPVPKPFDRFKIQTIGFADVRSALQEGWRDFRRKPLLSMLFGLIFMLFGLFFAAGLFVYDQIWMIIPAACRVPACGTISGCGGL